MVKHNYLKAIINKLNLLRQLLKTNNSKKLFSEKTKQVDNILFCHRDKVHIFVRGLADGKLHSAKNRHYSDCKFYKKQDLKVFCAVCRRRIL